MKSRTKLLTGIIALMLSCVIIFTTIAVSIGTKKSGVSSASAAVRTVSVSNDSLDAQSVFSEFENVELKTEGSKTSFTGVKQIDLSSLSDVDLISLDEMSDINFKDVTYYLSVDSDTSELELDLTFITENDEVITDTLHGIVITTETGKADALIFIENETVLLSELCGENALDNVGFFSRLWKAVKNIANKVAKILSEPLKLIIIVIEPFVEILGGVIELVTLPITVFKSISNYNNNINQNIEVDSRGYIKKQNKYGSWNFGFGNIKDNGCGVIATYNALVFTNKITNDASKVDNIANYRVKSFANLIKSYEMSSGALLKGVLGINPRAVEPMLTSYGVKVVTYGNIGGNLGFELACDNLQNNQMAILCYWWTDFGSNAPVGAHYTCITKSGNTYNFINDDILSCNSVSSFLHSNDINNGFVKGWIVTK